MSQLALTHLIGPRRDAHAIIAELAAAVGVSITIEDGDGRLLLGEAGSRSGDRYPVTLGGTGVGWVSGEGNARTVASLLDHLLSKEAERKALGTEVLHLYREVNLIYAFSEKLAALLDLEKVASLTLQEARHLIAASDGTIMLLDEASGLLTTLAGFGEALPHLTGFRRGEAIVGAIVASGVAEIVNDVDADPRRVKDGTGVRSLICAPLKVGERVIGIIALGSVTPAVYSAGALKLLNTLALQTATAIENARLFERTVQAALERERLMALHKETEIARAKLESEFEVAARIQADLFPAEMPGVDGYDLAARNRPARRCGGDYYEALMKLGPDGSARLLLCVADVSGKGMPAALLMSNMQATLRALVGRTASLQALAAHANDLLCASTSPNKYVTAAMLELDPATGAARYVSAGHADCFLLKANGDAERLESTGTPLGLMGAGQDYTETDVTVAPGDCVVLYSDGVPDAQDAADAEFGEQRLLDIVRAHAHDSSGAIVARVFEEIDRFVGDAPQFDDITMLVLRRSARPSTGRASGGSTTRTATAT
jgi:serine phosphatase RsbU (regulator of sigma subunit)